MLLATALLCALPTPMLEGDSYEELTREYGAAIAAWEQTRERRKHPARSFYGRFSELAEDGEGRALVWMTGNGKDAGLSVIARRSEMTRCYESLITNHLDEDYLADSLLELPKQATELDRKRLIKSCREAAGRAADRETQAAAWFAVAGLLAGDPEGAAEAEVVRLTLSMEYAGTRGAARVWDAMAEELERAWFRSDPDARGELLARFQKLAQSGSSRARLFLLQNAGAGGEETATWIEGMIDDSPDADWMGELITQLPSLSAGLGPDRVEKLYRRWMEKSQDKRRKLELKFGLGSMLLGIYADDEVRGAEALALLQEVKEADPDGLGRDVDGAINQLLYLRVGAVAPDFDAETVDGVAFKLSDYRGKVTVLEFWGFW